MNSFPGEPHGRVDPFKGVGLCHQVCCTSKVLRVTSGLFLNFYFFAGSWSLGVISDQIQAAPRLWVRIKLSLDVFSPSSNVASTTISMVSCFDFSTWSKMVLHRYLSIRRGDRGWEKAADCWRGICLLSKHGEIPPKDPITTEHNEIKHKTSQHNRGLTQLPGLVQPLVLPEHVEDQQGQGLLHGRQAHHHARGGGEKQADHLQSIWINIDLKMPTSVKRSQSIQM